MKSRVSRGPANAPVIIELGLGSLKTVAGRADAATSTAIIPKSGSPVLPARVLSLLRRLIVRIDLKDFPGSCCG